MSDTPNLDQLARELHDQLWTAVLVLDVFVPCGSPSVPRCGCCADETVRMRQQRRRDHLPGSRSRVVRVCSACDQATSDLTVPGEWNEGRSLRGPRHGEGATRPHQR